MELTVQEKEVYRRSLQQLLPRGSFWESQLADPHSDVSLLLAVRAEELYQVRQRMSDLQSESLPVTAIETLSDWERIFLGETNEDMTIEQRRQLMFALQSGGINIDVIRQIAILYGVEITNIQFPYIPCFFGRSHFGTSVFSSPAFYSIVYIYCRFNSATLQEEGLKRRKKAIASGTSGISCFGNNRFFHISLFIKEYANHIYADMPLEKFQSALENALLANHIIYFLYH